MRYNCLSKDYICIPFSDTFSSLISFKLAFWKKGTHEEISLISILEYLWSRK